MDRPGNDIPSRRELLDASTRDRGLSRPLLALVLGHVKIHAFSELLQTDFPDREEALPFLTGYFPRRLREGYEASFQFHPLRREIVATAAVNDLVNHAGVDFLSRITKESGASVGDVLAAYFQAVRDEGARKRREDVLRSGASADEVQTSLLEIEDALETATRKRLGVAAAAAP